MLTHARWRSTISAYRREYSSSVKTVYLPQIMRLKQLTSLTKIKEDEFLKYICLKSRKHFYCCYDDKVDEITNNQCVDSIHQLAWYKFTKIKDIMIPYHVVESTVRKYFTNNNIIIKLESDMNSILDVYKNRNAQSNFSSFVTILGHYNHGKTTLLDALGGTQIVDTEVSGITQVIRSRCVELPEVKSVQLSDDLMANDAKYVTFIDTPGQDIFYRMRNYGASIGDAAILVVAIDDGISPQTEESIGIIESLKIPVIVLINKIDIFQKTEERDSRIQLLSTALREYELLENALIIPISAKDRMNLELFIQELAEMLHRIHLSKSSNSLLTSEDSDVLINDERYDLITGCGIILNISKGQQQGTLLQTVIKAGSVSHQIYLLACAYSVWSM